MPEVSNKYLIFNAGTKYIYEGPADEGTGRIEVYVTNETKMVMGVSTIVVLDRVYLNGELTEETYDWYAQDKHGNVWYFGEDTKELSNGQVISTTGSWEAGVDGAKPGIVMKANPVVGDSYRQEYYQGEAEDMADIVSLNEDIVVPYGSFSDCLKTREWTNLDPDSNEYKYYCTEIGNLVFEVNVGETAGISLISIEHNT